MPKRALASKELVDAIVRYRARHNLNQEDFGKLCGVTKQTIWAIENGRASITQLTHAKILNVIESD